MRRSKDEGLYIFDDLNDLSIARYGYVQRMHNAHIIRSLLRNQKFHRIKEFQFIGQNPQHS